MAQKPNRKGAPMNLSRSEGFFALHPFESVFFETDRYYDGIVRKVRPMLKPMELFLECNSSIVNRTALCIAAYFEDQVSQLGIWSAFIHRHRKLYGKWLPWYDTASEDADYYEDEVNLQDIKFLLWMINVSTEEGYYTTPDNPIIEDCAKEIFDLLVEEFEQAPVNERFVSLLKEDKITEDFYTLKNLLRWMTKTCYLMAVPGWQMQYRQTLHEGIEKLTRGQGDEDMYSYFVSSYACMRFRVGPLALYPNEWLVLIRQQLGLSKDNDKILEMESTPYYPFLVVENKGKIVSLRSCRGIDYEVEKDSFQKELVKDLEPGTMLTTSLVRYKGVWGINGLAMILGKSKSTEPDEKILKDLGQQLFRNGLPIDYFGIVDTDPRVRQQLNVQIRKRLDEAVEQNHDSRLFYFKDARSLMLWEEAILGVKYDDKGREAFLNHYDSEDRMMGFISESYAVLGMARAETISDPANPHYEPQEAYLGGEFIYDKVGVLMS